MINLRKDFQDPKLQLPYRLAQATTLIHQQDTILAQQATDIQQAKEYIHALRSKAREASDHASKILHALDYNYHPF